MTEDCSMIIGPYDQQKAAKSALEDTNIMHKCNKRKCARQEKSGKKEKRSKEEKNLEVSLPKKEDHGCESGAIIRSDIQRLLPEKEGVDIVVGDGIAETFPAAVHSSGGPVGVIKKTQSISENGNDSYRHEMISKEQTTRLFWAMSKEDMVETSPIFPSSKQSRICKSGTCISLLLERNRLFQEVTWQGRTSLTMKLDGLVDTHNVILSLMMSCRLEAPIDLFVQKSILPESYIEQAEYVHLGMYQIQEWWKLSEHLHSVRMKQCPHLRNRRQVVYAIEEESDLSSTIYQGIACPRCLCAVSAVEWKGWTCAHCNHFTAASPVCLQLFRHLDTMDISFTGPRMDNGNAFMDKTSGVKRNIAIWNDGMKSARYELSSDNRSASIFHLLSSSSLDEISTKHLNNLIQRSIPYQRQGRQRAFAATFRPSDALKLDTSLATQSNGHVLIGAPQVETLVEDVENYISRFTDDSVDGFNQAAIVISQKTTLKVIEDVIVETSEDHLATYHLGPPALMILSTRGEKKDILSLTLRHGDIVYSPSIENLSNSFNLKVISGEVSVTCLLQSLQA